VKAELGVLGLTIGVSAAALGIGALLWGIRTGDARWLRLGRRFVFFVLAGAVVAVVAMEWALISHDFSLRYVAENNARGTPFLFTVTGLWAALEGSILLWLLVLGGYLTVMVVKFRARATDPLVAWATIVGLAVAVFFFALTLGPAQPFDKVASVPLDGNGPNALLQNHPLMAFHPPMLYLGYVGFTVPFAFAIAALITGRFGEGWLADVRRTTLVAWGFLTVGIVLGAWWSYEVLGWGGYWAWDPVENASLLPWLTATAFIHSVIVQERRAMLRVWNLSLVIATFCLTILGTFLTRSGVIDSVHSFTESPIGPWLLAFLGVCAFTGIGLIGWRADRLRAPGRIDSPLSREAAFLVNNLLFAGFAFVVLVGTVYPLLAEALQGRRLAVGGPYFNVMTRPLGIALLFFMAVAPALPWRATNGRVLRDRLLVPAWVGAGVMLVALVAGVDDGWALATYGLAAFALAGIARQFVLGVRARRRATASTVDRPTFGLPTSERPTSQRPTSQREVLPLALARTVRSNPRLYGGLIVHVGIVLMAVAIAASGTAATKREVRLTRGESATVAGLSFTYLGSHAERDAQKTSVAARVRIADGDDVLGVYEPSISSFPGTTQGIGTPSVRTGFTRDVYLTLVSSPNQRGRVTIGVAVNPMVVWLWIGGGVVALGTIVALLPSLRRRRGTRAPAPAAELVIDPDAEPAPREPEPVA
jgi:cytochrome c-type biogenesis protein CcmF